jgi:hypothetical protein
MSTLLVEQQSGAIYIALQQILPSRANDCAGRLAGAPMVATLIVYYAFSQKRRTAGLHLDCVGRKAHVACNKG